MMRRDDQFNLGILLSLRKSDDEKFKAEVVGLLRYKSFADLFEDFDISILADNSMTKQELLEVLGEFYSEEKQVEFGVIGIRIKLI